MMAGFRMKMTFQKTLKCQATFRSSSQKNRSGRSGTPTNDKSLRLINLLNSMIVVFRLAVKLRQISFDVFVG